MKNNMNIDYNHIVTREADNYISYINIFDTILREKLHFKYNGIMKNQCLNFINMDYHKFNRYINSTRKKLIVIMVYYFGSPVGVLILDNNMLNIFIKYEYRNAGLATHLLTYLNIKYVLPKRIINHGRSHAIKKLGSRFSFKVV